MTNLQRIRIEAGLSQSQLASLADVNKGVLQKYEINDRDINKAQGITIYKLAKALNVSMEELLEL